MEAHMSVKVLFFGSIADRLGKRECSLDTDKAMTVSDLVAAVGCSDFEPLLLAVNREQISDMGLLVQDGDEVALMPPFSGG